MSPHISQPRRYIPGGFGRVFAVVFAILLVSPLLGGHHDLLPLLAEGLEQQSVKHVLLLYSDSARTSFGKAQDSVLRQTLGDLKQPIEIFTESLDNNRIGEETYDKLVADFYRKKYENVNFDVVIAIKPAALSFLINHRADVFGNPDIVFCNVGRHEKVLERIGPGIPGALVDYDIRPSLELIQRLQPDTERVAVIFGASPIETGWLKLAQSHVDSARATFPIEYWVGLTTQEVQTRLASLPPHFAVLYVSEFTDREGRYFTPTDYLAQVASASEVPIYSMSYTYLGTGTVGGRVSDPYTDAKIAANFAVRILKGESPATLKSIIESPTVVFDARALQRFGISTSRLPAGSVVMFREPSIWSQYRKQFVIAAAFAILETLLILFLLLETRARKRAEESLAHRLALEGAISCLSTRLAASPSERIDSQIESGLRGILEIESADCICWYAKREGAASLVRKYSATAPGISQSPAAISPERMPRTAERLLRGEAVILGSPDDLPADARVDRQFFQELSTKSLVLLPSNGHTADKGVLGIAFASQDKGPTSGSISQYQVLANLLDITVHRKESHEARVESEQRFHNLFRKAPFGIALEDLEGRLLFVNPALSSILGYSEDELLSKSCVQFSNPEDAEDDWAHFQQLRSGSIDSYQMDKRYIRKDGTEIWGHLSISLLNDRSSPFPLIVATVQDITEVKTSHELLQSSESSLQNLAGRLIQAQEEERRRISLELHDDFGQRLSMLVIELSELSGSLADAGQSNPSQAAAELHRKGVDLATDIQNLSHDLHSSKLQFLGLPFALRNLGEKISSHQNIHISVHIENVPENLPSELALCIFRVAQEALNNVVKHSHARDAIVELTGTSDTIILKVRDLGIGFDPSASYPGIGFLSMRERLRIFGGELVVESILGNGTEIVAKVKLETAKTNQAAAG